MECTYLLLTAPYYLQRMHIHAYYMVVTGKLNKPQVTVFVSIFISLFGVMKFLSNLRSVLRWSVF